ncbi:2082_t:CDS:2, partial [Rhizophagus irregularis]
MDYKWTTGDNLSAQTGISGPPGIAKQCVISGRSGLLKHLLTI